MKLPTLSKKTKQPKQSSGLYKVLGVENSSSKEEIEEAFKKIAKKLHPDLGGDKDSFIQLLNAYRILRNPEKRKLYDETGEEEILTNNDFSEMVEGLIALFISAIASGLSEKADVDIIKVMQKAIKRDIGSIKEEEKGISKEIEKLEELESRIIKKSGGINLFSKTIMDRISNRTKNIRGLNKRKRILTLANEELDNYACITEIADVVQFYSYSSTSISASTV